MKVRLIIILLIFLVYSGGQLSLYAGVTGKISGVITDIENGEPLPGVNVVLEGTLIGAATDLDGYYIILNVPPGTYTMSVAMLGYREVRMENVRVSIDMTTTINVELEPTVLEIGESVTVVAERLLVRPDMTSSFTSVNSDDIANLPVQDVRDVLELNAGIIKTGNNFHIRGGRTAEVAYWVDGIAATDVFKGEVGVTVENSAVEELQVISGTFNAEYGQAMSGIINIITKEGSQNYHGQVKAYVGDYITGAKEFKLLKKVDTPVNPNTGDTTAVGTLENPLKEFNPTYNLEFTLSGPVPLVGKKLSFFSNVRYFFNEGHIYGREWYTPQGNPGDSSIVPLNPQERISAQVKLALKITSSIKLTYNLFWNRFQEERNYQFNMGEDFIPNFNDTFNERDFKYVPGALPQLKGYGMTHILSLSHALLPTTFYEIRLNNFYSEYDQYVYENPYDERYIHPSLIIPPTANSFYNIGMDMNHYDRSTSYWIAKFDLTSQINKVNQFKAGLELRLHELTLQRFQIVPKTIDGEEVVPFEPAIPEVGNVNRDDYNRKPREFSAYLQDKIELRDLIVNLGLRYDYFDANSVIPADPEDPNIYAPFKSEHIYKDWVEPPGDLSGSDLDEYKKQFEKYTPDERRAFMHKEVDAKMQLSPRLGIAYPISAEGVFHFSYGHFFQIPAFQFVYSNPDFKITSGTGYALFGNAGLRPQKTVMYEFGLQQQIHKNVVVDVTLFYRDVRDWVGTSPFIDTPNPNVRYSIYINKDYENVRGVTLRFEKRHSNNFSARFDYTFQVAEGTYSNPNDAYNATIAQEEPRKSLIPMSWDQNHTINGSVVYSISNWTFSLIGRYWTGKPYTPSFPVGEQVGAIALKGLRENSASLPNLNSVDLYLDKLFYFRALRFNIFLNIYNIFDQRGETWIYDDTGTAQYTTTIDPSKIPYNPERIGTVEDYVNQPGWYTEPRQIQVGITLGF